MLDAHDGVAQNAYTNSRATLTGQQEAFPVVTGAFGEATFRILDEGQSNARIVVSGSFRNLSSPVLADRVDLHIDYPGRNDVVLQQLVVQVDADSLGGTLNAEDNTFPLPAELNELQLGLLYINVHSRNHPDGEIRGIFGDVDQEQFYTNMFGSNVVPSVVSDGYGALWFNYNPTDSMLTVIGSYKHLSSEELENDARAVNLQAGLPGENGPELLTLNFISDTDRPQAARIENVFKLTAEQVVALRQGKIYANLSTKDFPKGEIRGQVLPLADVIFRAHLSGANEWPVVTTRAQGEIFGHLASDSLKVYGRFTGLTAPVDTSIGGGFHLHTGLAGQNGPVIIPLTARLDEGMTSGEFLLSENAYELTAVQREQLFQRGVYLNIHTTEYPTGELRGQMLPMAQSVFTAFLTGNQQIPSVITGGRGMVKVEANGDRMTATGSFQDLTSDLNTDMAGGVHLHAGYPGQAGPVVFPLSVADTDNQRSGQFLPAANTFTLTEGLTDTLDGRFLYVNVHSLDHPGGEIRGSVLAEAQTYFLAPLSGASQPQGVPTDATGMVAAEVRDSLVFLVGSFTDLGSEFATEIAGGMHLHRALAGSNGPIIAPIATEEDDAQRSAVVLSDSNRLVLSTDQLDSLFDRAIYVNVHSADYPAGEIRGQMLPLAGSYFHTTLQGMNETNPVVSSARGGLKLELIDSTLRLSGSVNMLEGDFDASITGGAHLHIGAAGSNGPITLPLTAVTSEELKRATFPIDSNVYTLTEAQSSDLRTGQLYANIHTTGEPTGEVRGQVRSEPNLFPASSEILSPMDGDSLILEGSNQQEFRVSYAAVTDPDMDTVVYVWQLATDENFDTIVFAANTGRDTFFSDNFGTVDVLLDGAGIDTNATATLYHRVLASDGSNFTPSEGAEITLTRDSIVSNRNFLPEGFAGRSYPNPTSSRAGLTYELTTQEAFRGRIQLFNQLGQLQQSMSVEVATGRQEYRLATDRLASGQYFLSLRKDDGRQIQISRIIVR